ncbi:MAG: SIS domain-containing protein [Lachnospiraceae bacterium]|nr:SIS domain-containing protein [Lachnospiraceae bacterium]
MMQYFESLLSTINDSLHSIDVDQFEKIVQDCVLAINNKNKIIATGLGKNVPICEKFVGTMNSLGLDASFLHTNSAVHGDLGIVKKGDVVILLTKSGETEESIYLSQLLRKREVCLWLLSFQEDSTLNRLIENSIILKLDHEGDIWNIMPNNSTTLNLIILQAIAMQIAKKQNITLAEFKANHPGGNIGELLR